MAKGVGDWPGGLAAAGHVGGTVQGSGGGPVSGQGAGRRGARFELLITHDVPITLGYFTRLLQTWSRLERGTAW